MLHGSQVSSKTCVEGLFQLIGFKLVRKSWLLLASSKRLRVVVDTSEKGAVDNKESRKRKLVAEIQKILELVACVLIPFLLFWQGSNIC